SRKCVRQTWISSSRRYIAAPAGGSRSFRVARPAVHQPARLTFTPAGVRDLVEASLLGERHLHADAEVLAQPRLELFLQAFAVRHLAPYFDTHFHLIASVLLLHDTH